MPKKFTLDYVKNFCLTKNMKYCDDIYDNKDASHNFECLICGHKWETSFNPIHNRNQGCRNCAGNLPQKIEDVKKYCLSKYIEYLDPCYKHLKEYHNFKCLKCNKPWETQYQNIYNSNSGCPFCANNVKFDLDYVKSYCFNRNLIFEDQYYNNKEEIHNFKCLTCNISRLTSFGNIKNNKSQCPTCSNCKKYTVEEIKKICLKKEMEYLDDFYKDNKEIHKFCCLKSGHKGYEWKTAFAGILTNRRGCKYCATNHVASTKFHEELKTQFPNFKMEVNTKNILNNPLFRFDNYDPNLKLAIEYDGDKWHSKNKYQYNTERDQRKEIDCLKNNIKLIRIDDKLYRRSTRKDFLMKTVFELINKQYSQPTVIKIFYDVSTKSQIVQELNIKDYI